VIPTALSSTLSTGGGTVGTEAGAHAFGPSDHIDRVFDIESSSPRKPRSTA